MNLNLKVRNKICLGTQLEIVSAGTQSRSSGLKSMCFPSHKEMIPIHFLILPLLRTPLLLFLILLSFPASFVPVNLSFLSLVTAVSAN